MDVSALGSTPKVGDVRVANVFSSLQYDLLFSDSIIRQKKIRSGGLFSTEDIFSILFFYDFATLVGFKGFVAFGQPYMSCVICGEGMGAHLTVLEF